MSGCATAAENQRVRALMTSPVVRFADNDRLMSITVNAVDHRRVVARLKFVDGLTGETIKESRKVLKGNNRTAVLDLRAGDFLRGGSAHVQAIIELRYKANGDRVPVRAIVERESQNGHAGLVYLWQGGDCGPGGGPIVFAQCQILVLTPN